MYFFVIQILTKRTDLCFAYSNLTVFMFSLDKYKGQKLINVEKNVVLSCVTVMTLYRIRIRRVG